MTTISLVLAFAGVEVWLGMMGLTYQDIRDAYGKKNLFFGNRMLPIEEPRSCPYISLVGVKEFLST
ncbi:unnamed protein product [Clonostachys chloroleuca]|uniref:Uncharacterized protein n=1 Tax=Clonostachys chloroleuca TaxID=1926264 RepID=A0AA35LQH9_9HYPO|nr:unnamed protein product [Clonostachys chloroleuca]